MATPWKTVLDDGTEVIRTCAWSAPGCHPVGCGLKVFVKDGKLIKVEGDPEHPITKGRLCVRCLALKDYVYHPDRIIYPMKRKREDRGLDRWEKTTWDEAYQIIIESIKRTKEEYGPEHMVVFTGTGRMGCKFSRVDAYGICGSPNAAYTQSGWSCYIPRYAINNCVIGGGYPEFDYGGDSPLLYDDPDYVLPKYIVLWGKEPLKSNPDGLFGHVIIDLMKRGAEVIMVDPRLTWLASNAKYHLQLKPGTDGALALALLNVVISEDLVDHAFIDEWTYGYEQLAERVQQYTPEWAAPLTWISADVIREVGRELGTAKPWGLSWGLAVDQNPNGVQIGHSLLSLVAITGNLDVPGGTVLGERIALAGKAFLDLSSCVSEELFQKCIGVDEYPIYPILCDTAVPDLLLEAFETGKPYKPRWGWIQQTNLLAPTNSAQPHRWHEAMRDMDFCFATDLVMTPTIMAFCDVFLPLSTTIEYDNFVMTLYGNNMGIIGALNKCISVGDTRSDLEVVSELGNMINPETFHVMEDPMDFVNDKLKAYDGLDFEQLREQVTWQPGKLQYKKYETGRLRPDKEPGFPTSTGKVELYSCMFEQLGEDPLPYYMEPKFNEISRPDMAKKYPLTLTTGARDWASFHSEHRQIPVLREITPDPLVEIHPDTAAELGIREGDWVYIENPWGKARERAKVTPTVHRQVVAAAHGWWYPEQDGEEPNLFGVWESNINDLVPNNAIGKLGFGAHYKCLPCRVYKAE